MVSGIVIVAVAAVLLIGAGRGDDGPGAVPAASDPSAITLSARDVSVVTQVYEPGQTSGWHSHPGIHAVAVLSGVLTVYDGDCRRETFEPGRPYVGGQQTHLVRNETDAPVTMIVTYLNPSVPANSSRHVPPPAGCTIG
jgi:quercetin dioxygenase-like cupin family protein